MHTCMHVQLNCYTFKFDDQHFERELLILANALLILQHSSKESGEKIQAEVELTDRRTHMYTFIHALTIRDQKSFLFWQSSWFCIIWVYRERGKVDCVYDTLSSHQNRLMECNILQFTRAAFAQRPKEFWILCVCKSLGSVSEQAGKNVWEWSLRIKPFFLLYMLYPFGVAKFHMHCFITIDIKAL